MTVSKAAFPTGIPQSPVLQEMFIFVSDSIEKMSSEFFENSYLKKQKIMEFFNNSDKKSSLFVSTHFFLSNLVHNTYLVKSE